MALIAAPAANSFAAAGLRLGESLMRRMCNAELVVGAQSMGVFFNSHPGDVVVGGVSIQAREAVVRAWAADLPTPLPEGSALTINGEPYVVATEPLVDTRTGMAMRAASQNPQSARLMGVDVMKVNMITFGVGTGLAALAGALIAPAFFANPTFGTDYFILPAFVIVVLGTMGNFAGALIGGLVIGVAEGLGGLVFGPALRQLVSLLLFVVVLLFLPRGLFKGKVS